MRSALIAVGLAVVLAAWVAPARAEHGGPSSTVDLNVDLKMGGDSFRLSGQLLGLAHAYGAWINGQVRPDGFAVDGRLQEGDRAFNFKLNAEMTEWLLRTLLQGGI